MACLTVLPDSRLLPTCLLEYNTVCFKSDQGVQFGSLKFSQKLKLARILEILDTLFDELLHIPEPTHKPLSKVKGST